MLGAYLALNLPTGRLLSALLSPDNLYFALLSSISGPNSGLYLCVYCLQGHTNLPELRPPIILESEPVMCSDRELNPGLHGSPEG